MALKIKYKLGDLITQRREKYDGTPNLPIIGVSKTGFIPPKQVEADISLYNMFYMNDFVFNPARMELNSIAFNDIYSKAICSSLYEIFYVSRLDLVIPAYLKLFVKRDEFARHCEFLGSGSAREYCRVANISEIEIELPSIEEQEKIVRQYKIIENRIFWLNDENTKLQELMQIVYNNANKNCEMGLSEFCNFQEGPGIRVWQFTETGIPFVNIRCIRDNEIDLKNTNFISEEEGNGKYKHFLLKEDDIIVSTSGTIGKSAIVRKSHLPLCLNTSIIRFTPKIKSDYSYLYCLINSKKFVDKMYENATGSAQLNLGPTQLNKMVILVATEEERKEMNEKLLPAINLLNLNLEEISVLNSAKDLLLSKI